MNITFEVKNKSDETIGYGTIVTTIYYTGRFVKTSRKFR